MAEVELEEEGKLPSKVQVAAEDRPEVRPGVKGSLEEGLQKGRHLLPPRLGEAKEKRLGLLLPPAQAKGLP